MDDSYYADLRARYTPSPCKLIFVAESPPASGKYFYDPTGRVTEPLFRAMMKSVLQVSPDTKADGLALFMRSGYLLLDATYTPVNAGLSNKDRDATILRDYSCLLDRLLALDGGRRIPILLIKRNVCMLLEPRLLKDGFRVLNRGKIVPFPACGQQSRFTEAVEDIFQNSNTRS